MRILATAAIVLTIITAACAGDRHEKRSPQTRQLYEKSVALATLYIDSLKNNTDSTSIARLMHGYEAAVTKLNYDFPPEIYTQISEGENDTLTRLTMRFIELRDSLLYRIDHPSEPSADTIAPDTIM